MKEDHFTSADGKDVVEQFLCRLKDESPSVGLRVGISGAKAVHDGTWRPTPQEYVRMVRHGLEGLVGVLPPEEFESLSVFALNLSRKRESVEEHLDA